MPEIMGAGLAVFDFDNDGDLDIYLVDSGVLGDRTKLPVNRLYAQLETGAFEDVTDSSGISNHEFGMGASVADYDNDGDLDLFASNYGPDKLYRNEGNGYFTDVTDIAGLNIPEWSMSAGFCDLNRDGWLDLVVTTYVNNSPPRSCTSNTGTIEYCGPKAYRGLADRLLFNNGDGSFSDATQSSGLGALPGKGLGVICFDFNSDHWPDVFVANDGEKNHLWINQGNDTFEERGVSFGVALNLFGQPEASMGIAFGDIDNDLTFDALVTHLDQETNTLYANDANKGLLDVTSAAGLGAVSMPYTGFGTAFLDADHDGDLDLLVANGKVRRTQGQASSAIPGEYGVSNLNHEYAERNLFFLNDGTGKFSEACELAGDYCSKKRISRGLITADLDRDGDLDVLISNNSGMAALYRNDFAKTGNWASISVVDPLVRRAAIGARVELTSGGRVQARPVLHSRSYLSSGPAEVHFGLGGAENIDEIRVVWPDGDTETFPGGAVNRHIRLEKGNGRP